MNDLLIELDNKVRAFFRWVYSWITVLAGIVSGALAFVPDMLNQLLTAIDAAGIVDFTTFGISSSTAAKITFGVAAAKGFVAWWNSRRSAV